MLLPVLVFSLYYGLFSSTAFWIGSSYPLVCSAQVPFESGRFKTNLCTLGSDWIHESLPASGACFEIDLPVWHSEHIATNKAQCYLYYPIRWTPVGNLLITLSLSHAFHSDLSPHLSAQ